MKIVPGDMVTLITTLTDAYTPLWSTYAAAGRPCGALEVNRLAIVVQVESADAVEVCVVGEKGMGWTYGGLLKVIR